MEPSTLLLHEESQKYLIINNISKKNNVYQLVRTAEAYKFAPIIVCGPKLRDQLHASGLSHLPYYTNLQEVQQMMHDIGVEIVGIEILDSAVSVLDFSFPTKIAIMPGNEGEGMNETQKKICDKFIFVPQYGHATASLNVFVATGMVMHHHFMQHQAAQQSNYITTLGEKAKITTSIVS